MPAHCNHCVRMRSHHKNCPRRILNAPLCRHCRTRLVKRPRGLCWACYQSAARDLYPPQHEQRIGCGVGAVLVYDCEPTTAAPGSEAKLAVLEFRAANRQRLFHPADATA